MISATVLISIQAYMVQSALVCRRKRQGDRSYLGADRWAGTPKPAEMQKSPQGEPGGLQSIAFRLETRIPPKGCYVSVLTGNAAMGNQ